MLLNCKLNLVQYWYAAQLTEAPRGALTSRRPRLPLGARAGVLALRRARVQTLVERPRVRTECEQRCAGACGASWQGCEQARWVYDVWQHRRGRHER